MWVLIVVELRAVPPFSNQLRAAGAELAAQFPNAKACEADAPSVGYVASRVCRSETAIELVCWLSEFTKRHPHVVVFAAYELDDMHWASGYVLFHGGEKLADEGGDCAHFIEGWPDPLDPLLTSDDAATEPVYDVDSWSNLNHHEMDQVQQDETWGDDGVVLNLLTPAVLSRSPAAT